MLAHVGLQLRHDHTQLKACQVLAHLHLQLAWQQPPCLEMRRGKGVAQLDAANLADIHPLDVTHSLFDHWRDCMEKLERLDRRALKVGKRDEQYSNDYTVSQFSGRRNRRRSLPSWYPSGCHWHLPF